MKRTTALSVVVLMVLILPYAQIPIEAIASLNIEFPQINVNLPQFNIKLPHLSFLDTIYSRIFANAKSQPLTANSSPVTLTRTINYEILGVKKTDGIIQIRIEPNGLVVASRNGKEGFRLTSMGLFPNPEYKISSNSTHAILNITSGQYYFTEIWQIKSNNFKLDMCWNFRTATTVDIPMPGSRQKRSHVYGGDEVEFNWLDAVNAGYIPSFNNNSRVIRLSLPQSGCLDPVVQVGKSTANTAGNFVKDAVVYFGNDWWVTFNNGTDIIAKCAIGGGSFGNTNVTIRRMTSATPIYGHFGLHFNGTVILYAIGDGLNSGSTKYFYRSMTPSAGCNAVVGNQYNITALTGGPMQDITQDSSGGLYLTLLNQTGGSHLSLWTSTASGVTWKHRAADSVAAGFAGGASTSFLSNYTSNKIMVCKGEAVSGFVQARSRIWHTGNTTFGNKAIISSDRTAGGNQIGAYCIGGSGNLAYAVGPTQTPLQASQINSLNLNVFDGTSWRLTSNITSSNMGVSTYSMTKTNGNDNIYVFYAKSSTLIGWSRFTSNGVLSANATVSIPTCTLGSLAMSPRPNTTNYVGIIYTCFNSSDTPNWYDVKFLAFSLDFSVPHRIGVSTAGGGQVLTQQNIAHSGNDWYVSYLDGTNAVARCIQGGNIPTSPTSIVIGAVSGSPTGGVNVFGNGTKLLFSSGGNGTETKTYRAYDPTANCGGSLGSANTIVSASSSNFGTTLTQNSTGHIFVALGNTNLALYRSSDASGVSWSSVTGNPFNSGTTQDVIVVNYTDTKILLCYSSGSTLYTRIFHTTNETFGTETQISTNTLGSRWSFSCLGGSQNRAWIVWRNSTNFLKMSVFDGSSWSLEIPVSGNMQTPDGITTTWGITKANGNNTFFVVYANYIMPFGTINQMSATSITWKRYEGTTFIRSGAFNFIANYSQPLLQQLAISPRPNSTGFIGIAWVTQSHNLTLTYDINFMSRKLDFTRLPSFSNVAVVSKSTQISTPTQDMVLAIGNQWLVHSHNTTGSSYIGNYDISCSVGGRQFGGNTTVASNSTKNLGYFGTSFPPGVPNFYNGTHMLYAYGTGFQIKLGMALPPSSGCNYYTNIVLRGITPPYSDTGYPFGITQNASKAIYIARNVADSGTNVGNIHLWMTKNDGLTWSDKGQIAAFGATTANNVQLVNMTNDRIMSCMSSVSGLQYRVYYSNNNTFSTTGTITSSLSDWRGYTCHTGNNGKVFAFWINISGTFRIQYSIYDGSSWSTAVTIYTGASASITPYFSVTKMDGINQFFVYYFDRLANANYISWSRSDSNGVFTQSASRNNIERVYIGANTGLVFIRTPPRPNASQYVGIAYGNGTTTYFAIARLQIADNYVSFTPVRRDGASISAMTCRVEGSINTTFSACIVRAVSGSQLKVAIKLSTGQYLKSGNVSGACCYNTWNYTVVSDSNVTAYTSSYLATFIFKRADNTLVAGHTLGLMNLINSTEQNYSITGSSGNVTLFSGNATFGTEVRSVRPTFMNNNVKNSSTIQFNVTASNQGFLLKLLIGTLTTTRYSDLGSTAFTFTQSNFRAPNGTTNNIGSGNLRTVYAQNGTWIPISTIWQNSNVNSNGTSFTTNGASNSYSFKVKIFRITLLRTIDQNSGGISATVKLKFLNSSTLTSTTTNATGYMTTYVQNDTRTNSRTEVFDAGSGVGTHGVTTHNATRDWTTNIASLVITTNRYPNFALQTGIILLLIYNATVSGQTFTAANDYNFTLANVPSNSVKQFKMYAFAGSPTGVTLNNLPRAFNFITTAVNCTASNGAWSVSFTGAGGGGPGPGGGSGSPSVLHITFKDEQTLAGYSLVKVSDFSLVNNTLVRFNISTATNFDFNFTVGVTNIKTWFPYGLSYYRNRLALSSGDSISMNIYLVNPATATLRLCTFQVNDLTGQFSGADFLIDKQSTAGLIRIHDQALDVQNKAQAWLIKNNTYTLSVVRGNSTHSFGNYIVDDCTTTVILTIGTFNLGPNTNIRGLQIYWDACRRYPSGVISLNYTDTKAHTTSLNILIWNRTGINYNNTFYSIGTFGVTSATGDSNQTHVFFSQINVVNTDYGTFSEGKPVRTCITGTGAASGPFGLYTPGGNSIIPQAWYNLLSIVFLSILAMLFGALSAGTGAVVVALFALFFHFIGWLVIPGDKGIMSAIIFLVLTIAVLNKLVEHRREAN